MRLSVVIPAYNERERLPRTLDRVAAFLTARGEPFEILVVDDGSSDGTAELVRERARALPQLGLVSYPENRGKGFAVREGALRARGEAVLVCDADGAAPIEELARLERALERGADIAVGSRAVASVETRIEARLLRKALGRTFARCVNLLGVPGIRDTQCGFKLFTRDACRRVFPRQRLSGFAFDVELLRIAWLAGLKVEEVPINWRHVPGSRINLVVDGLRMLLDLVRIRLAHPR
ncbi:MAG: glycosyltransferase family 2 protein [Elusimicrobia bacterium]|nr:glycosyltransferase family 2 protein [Elusimicrobiota bacterium]